MQAPSTEHRIDGLEKIAEKVEKKVDDGFAETKAEFGAVRAEIGGVHRSVQAIWLTMILGFAAILLQRHI
jgi:hypothetical protein